MDKYVPPFRILLIACAIALMVLYLFWKLSAPVGDTVRNLILHSQLATQTDTQLRPAASEMSTEMVFDSCEFAVGADTYFVTFGLTLDETGAERYTHARRHIIHAVRQALSNHLKQDSSLAPVGMTRARIAVQKNISFELRTLDIVRLDDASTEAADETVAP